MNEFKYQITQLIFVGILGLGGYWALTNLDNGITYTRDEIIEVAKVIEPVDKVPTEVDPVIEEPVTEPKKEEPVIETPVDVNSELKKELEDLRKTGAILANGSSGDRVRLIQRFLQVYFPSKDISIDGAYGPGTARIVKEFQVKELGGGDGRVGPNTLKSMISTL